MPRVRFDVRINLQFGKTFIRNQFNQFCTRTPAGLVAFINDKIRFCFAYTKYLKYMQLTMRAMTIVVAHSDLLTIRAT